MKVWITRFDERLVDVFPVEPEETYWAGGYRWQTPHESAEDEITLCVKVFEAVFGTKAPEGTDCFEVEMTGSIKILETWEGHRS